ncbi:uncharacterized protein LOC114280058 [Camellia sinensis]|uniref:uncharacterized protein LOC114280058 n=1 Tax=Camellia sinensis TaxID=4442 RepID=UPI0010357C58|nr:uncharacterized protein LOC114280058 [Camellia sinensis]
MESLLIRAHLQLSMSCHRRVLFHQARPFYFLVILICTLFCIAACGLCSINGMPSSVEYDLCESCTDNYNPGFQDAYVRDVSSGCVSGMGHLSLENVCSNSNLFCFPSTLPGFLCKGCSPESTVLEVSPVQPGAKLPEGSTQARNNLSWSLDYGMFKLLSGRAVSCSLNSQDEIHDISSLQTSKGNQNYVSSCGGPFGNQKSPSPNLNENSEMKMIKSGFLDGSLSPNVEISPPLLDWGQKYLYFPSFSFLTVANTHSDSILCIYKPFSTNTQFYPCNFSELFLGPGEVASICFVFLPTWLGMSSAHLILQTSSGGFLIQAKGFAVESPYGLRALAGLDVSSGGRWTKKFSLFNPFDETLYVEEVTVWISVSIGNTSHLSKAICRIENFQGSEEHSVLHAKSGQVDSPQMAMGPYRNWDIGPGSTEAVIEIDFTYYAAGKISGAFCMQLLRPSQDKSDTIVVPLEAELGGESANDLIDAVSVSLETLLPCDSSDTVVVALLLRNGTPHLLNVVKISLIGESTKLFQIKYKEGLILFPGTDTHVAVVSYIPLPIGLHDYPSESPDINWNCKLVILTNDSSNPQIEMPCKDIVSICSKLDSYLEYEQQSGNAENANARTGSLLSGVQSPSLIKEMEAAEPDELVLGNWKSQGTASSMSVLDNHGVVFPMVQIGTHHSEWITVKNPSEQPVVMQLILNAGEIIDECRAPDGLLQPSLSSGLVLSENTSPTRYGFSISEKALTEAYVHPYGTASFGPIIFHPSNRCGWRSSALIRNNLSGVEWLSLRGYGGSFSLDLFEGSKPIPSLEFKFNLPSRLNLSPPEMSHHKEETTHACSKPLSKELYAKNTGDLPLEVRRIEVSGTECELDGFVVHTCKGFALEPGESTKLLISYQADFSTVMVQRDLELALATGIVVIPMKASLPLNMLNLCKKSMFRMQVHRIFFAILLAAFVMFLILFCILPQLMGLGYLDYLFKSGKSSIATVGRVGKSSCMHFNTKNGNKFSISSKMNGLLRSVGEEETSMLESVNRYPDGEVVASKQGITALHLNPTVENQRQTQEEMAFGSCILQESSTVENSDVREASKVGKLTVRIGKEKGRRKRKKKCSGTGLSGIFDVASSQSGNSTPSSPLSPVTSFTPKRLWPQSYEAGQSVESSNQFGQVVDQPCGKSSGVEPASKANILEPKVSVKYSNKSCFFFTQEKPSAPRKMPGKSVLLPSATFPCTGRPSTSTIAPHARAPGSKLYNQKTVNLEEATGLEDQFRYDIWGNHLFGLHLMGRSKEVSTMTSSATESHSDSFFVRGPQTLLTKPQPNSVSSSHLEG